MQSHDKASITDDGGNTSWIIHKQVDLPHGRSESSIKSMTHCHRQTMHVDCNVAISIVKSGSTIVPVGRVVTRCRCEPYDRTVLLRIKNI